MPQQTLQTKRITLVPLADEHLEWEVELDSDREVMRYLSGRASTREEVEAGHARRLAAARKVDGLGFWVGLVDDEFVGWWILQPAHGPDQPDDPNVADLGYRLLQRHWRRGLASEGRGSCCATKDPQSGPRATTTPAATSTASSPPTTSNSASSTTNASPSAAGPNSPTAQAQRQWTNDYSDHALLYFEVQEL